MSLYSNNISDISVLEKVNFKELADLNLARNKIKNIKIFEKIKFDKLERLNLRSNSLNNDECIPIINKLRKKIKFVYFKEKEQIFHI